MANFEVNWSGERYSLCYGEWTIRRNGVDVSNLIPGPLRNYHMNTRKEYSAWHFTEDWDEEWEYYFDGLSAKKWIRKNRYWISKICCSKEEEFQLYHAINDADWRHGSCGGCI